MTRPADPPLRLHLSSSRQLSGVLLALHGVALLALGHVELPALWALGLGLLVGVGGWRVLRRHAWLSAPRSVLELHWSAESGWRLYRSDGSIDGARLLGDSYVHPYFVLLAFRVAGRRETVSLLRDQVDADSHRRLRARLRLAPPGL